MGVAQRRYISGESLDEKTVEGNGSTPRKRITKWKIQII